MNLSENKTPTFVEKSRPETGYGVYNDTCGGSFESGFQLWVGWLKKCRFL